MLQNTAINTVEQLTEILDSVPTAVMVVDRDGRMVLVNIQAEQLFGYHRSELLGEQVDMLLPERFRPGHPDLREGYLQRPSARPMGAGRDLYGRRKNGVEIPLEIGLNPLPTEQGTFVVSVIVDISERKRLEARFRATVESAPVAMVMIDQEGRIQLVNAELERLFDYPSAALLGQPIEVLIPERYRGAHPGLRHGFFATPEARRMGAGRDLAGRRRDGSEFPVEIGLNPVATEGGTWVLAAIVDLTERQRAANAALQRTNEALERSNIELQRFAYVASHDLQTPLRNVASFVELLSTTYADRLGPQGQDWIRRVVLSVKQLQVLIRDLLAYARVDSQAHPFQPIAGAELFDAARALLENALQEAGAELTRGELPRVTGDRSQLVQLLINLIGNSIKYRGSAAPQIRVSAQRQGDDWCFAVADNGIGIEARHQTRIFEIFERLHGQGEYPGSGIGLAVCRRVVHRHGGRIWVESTPGQGSTFYFTIPEPGGADR